jgi:hypothetical protein
MNEAVEQYKKMVSQRGWIEVNINRAVWVPCPPVFPEGMTKETWAAMCAEAWWENAPESPRPEDVISLDYTLSTVYDTLYEDFTCQLAWLHLPDPRIMPLPLRVGIWAARGPRQAAFRVLTNADDPRAMKQPVVTEFDTEDLGTGMKTMRYVRLGDGGICGAVNYAWRSDRYETDVRLFAASDDLGRLERAIPDIENFARGMRIVERGLRY